MSRTVILWADSGSSLPPQPGVRECSPDPDAIGILACHHEDDKPTDPK
jgi:hypothetical protein